MRLIPYGILSAAGAGQAAAGFGILRAYQSGKTIRARAITSDSSGNLYLGFENVTDYDMVTLKLNSSYAVQWQRNNGVATGSINSYIDNIFVDSSSNVYVLGRGPYNTTINYGYYYLKYDSNGVLQWQRYIPSDQNLGEYTKNSFTDGTNYGVWSRYSVSTNRRLGLFGVTSTGTTHQTKQVYTSTTFPQIGGAFWKSGSGYAACNITDGTTFWGAFLKFDSSYAPTSNARYLVNSFNDSFGPNTIINTGTNANYSWGLSYPDGSNARPHLVKFDDSLNITWNYTLTGLISNVTANAITGDTSGNIYCVGASNIVKFDSSGNILWSRRLLFNGTAPNALSILVNGSYLYITASFNNLDTSTTEAFIFQLPIDGSGTGSTTIGTNTVSYTTYGTTITLTSQTMNKTTHTFTNTSTGDASTTRSGTDAAGSLSFQEVLI